MPSRRPRPRAGTNDDPVPALKRQVAAAIVAACDGWTQVNAAFLLGIDQRGMSALRNGRLERLSLDQLIRLLARADAYVELRVTPIKGRWRLFNSPIC